VTTKDLLKPQNAPEPIVKYLITNLKLNTSWAYNLKSVMKPGQENGIMDFRLYNDADVRAKNLKIKDFDTFNDHPTMLLFEGNYDPKNQNVQITKKN
jgi:hypothetical protein